MATTTTEKMYECETRTMFMENGVKVPRWVTRPVRLVDDGKDIRCVHCRGLVRLRRQKVAGVGAPDHVDHVNREDSEHCQAGRHFKGGEHRPSQQPVV